MENKTILFDLDDTLFSKKKFIKNLSENLNSICEVTDEEILNLEEKYVGELDKPGSFRVDGFLKYLEQKFNKKIKLEDFITNKFEIYSKSLFNETIPVLNKLKDNFKLGIYSQGFDDIQKIKIEYSGIKDFFDKKSIYIDRNKLNPDFVKNLPDRAIIVDDKRKVIEELKILNRFDIIWINRNDDKQINGIITIKNLNELSGVVNF